MTTVARRSVDQLGRLSEALTDPARRERSAVLVLVLYAALWTVYGAIAKGSRDIHNDMSEQFLLAQDLSLGYPKHPPLPMLIVRAWFELFPAADWAYYLLAMTNAALALWIAWRLSARFLDGDKRVLGLALLTLVPFFNFHALKFNSNTILMPLWAATTLTFLRSFETRRVLDAALAGAFAAAAMYGKYWSIFLLLGLALAALADPRRGAYFRSPAPWITVVAGGIVIAPHVMWLVENNFAPFSYAVFVHADSSWRSSLGSVLEYVSGSAAYVCMPLLLVFVVARPGHLALKDTAWPSEPPRRLAAAAFWAPLLLPALVASLAGVRLTSLWSMSAWTLLPVMLLSSPLVAVSRRDLTFVLGLAVIFPFIMIAAAPAVGIVIHRSGSLFEAHSAPLAQPVEQLWREATDRPLKVFGSVDVLTDGVPFYLREHPRAVRILERPATSRDWELIASAGVVLVCPASAASCLDRAMEVTSNNPPGKRREVEVKRSYFGVDGVPSRYVIFAIPPR
jgi:4-amino-4-deoxy-L-arabinose transferase-like glycosyltransferase